MGRIEIYFDGSCQPVNPGGRAGFGWIAYSDGQTIGQNYGFIGEGEAMSNNVAEYGAVLDAMEWADAKFPESLITFIGDSRLVVDQLSGRMKIKRGLYIHYAFKARMRKRSHWEFKWIPREQNQEADILSAMGSQAVV